MKYTRKFLDDDYITYESHELDMFAITSFWDLINRIFLTIIIMGSFGGIILILDWFLDLFR